MTSVLKLRICSNTTGMLGNNFNVTQTSHLPMCDFPADKLGEHRKPGPVKSSQERILSTRALSQQQPQFNGNRGPQPLGPLGTASHPSSHSPPSTASWCPFWQTSGTSQPIVPLFGIRWYFNQLTYKNHSDHVPYSLSNVPLKLGFESCASFLQEPMVSTALLPGMVIFKGHAYIVL